MEASGSSRAATLTGKNQTGPLPNVSHGLLTWWMCEQEMFHDNCEAAAVKKTQIHPKCHFTEITIPSSLCRCIRLSDLFQHNKLVRKKIHWYPQTASAPNKKKRKNKTISWFKRRLVRFSTFEWIKHRKKMKNVEGCKRKMWSQKTSSADWQVRKLDANSGRQPNPWY